MRKGKAMRDAVVLLGIALLTIAGCGPSGPTWVDTGATYTTSSLPGVLGKADITKYKDQPVEKSAELRQQALGDLRTKGERAAAAADLITKTLPANSTGVPVYVEKANVGDQAAYILVEAIGPPGGRLTVKRVWALATTGAVLYVGSR